MTPSRWNQQGSKLLANGTAGDAAVGFSVALSRHGQAIVGGPLDNHGVGAAWAYVLAGGVWTQKGDKLVGTGAGGGFGPSQGTAVAISADGKTAIVGGPRDDNDKYDSVGAAWVYEFSDNAWSQQGDKISGDATRGCGLGCAVALSLNGNIAIVGGTDENSNRGAVWVFERKFKNNGEFLIWDMVCRLPCDLAEGAMFGFSVAVNAGGTVAIVGGTGDNDDVGAAWIFEVTNGTWKQAAKLVGTHAVGQSQQGCSVALSGTGNTAIVGGWQDNSGVGAAWVYERNANDQGPWKQQGEKLIGNGAVGAATQGSLRRNVRGQPERHRGRVERQQLLWRGVDFHPPGRRTALEPAARQAGGHRCCRIVRPGHCRGDDERRRHRRRIEGRIQCRGELALGAMIA